MATNSIQIRINSYRKDNAPKGKRNIFFCFVLRANPNMEGRLKVNGIHVVAAPELVPNLLHEKVRFFFSGMKTKECSG